MRIVYATTVPLIEQSAPAHHVLASSAAIRHLGHSVEGIYPRPRLDRCISSRSFDSETLLARPRIRGGARLIHPHLAIALKRRDWASVDALYLRTGPSEPLTWALRGVPVPKVLEINGSDIFRIQTFSAFARQLDLILVDAEPLRRRCIEVTGISEEKVRVHLSPALDPSDVQARSMAEARKELGIEPSSQVVVHVSGFQPHHDFRTIETAIRQAVDQLGGETSNWVLIGSGPAHSKERERFADLVDAGVVWMPGQLPIEKVMTYIAAADVCINVFTKERLADGNLRAYKLFQYMGSARPTVEAVDESLPVHEWARKSLYLIPPESPSDLSKAVADILSDPELWSVRATHGQEYVMKHRTWKAAMRNTVEHLEPLLSEPTV